MSISLCELSAQNLDRKLKNNLTKLENPNCLKDTHKVSLNSQETPFSVYPSCLYPNLIHNSSTNFPTINSTYWNEIPISSMENNKNL